MITLLDSRGDSVVVSLKDDLEVEITEVELESNKAKVLVPTDETVQTVIESISGSTY